LKEGKTRFFPFQTRLYGVYETTCFAIAGVLSLTAPVQKKRLQKEEEKAPQVVDDKAPSSSAAKDIVVSGADGDVDMEGGSQHFGGDMVSQKAVMEIGDISKMVGTIPHSILANHTFICCIHLLIYPNNSAASPRPSRDEDVYHPEER
jgi:hypothetical protein